jgi:hypothetical protein
MVRSVLKRLSLSSMRSLAPRHRYRLLNPLGGLITISAGQRNEAYARHWPLDLIELHSTIAHPLPSSTTPPKHPTLRLIMHLSSPPADKLLMPNTVEACQTQFINALKEADFVRWRNTNKVTNMRRADLESGWEGIVKGASWL